MDFGRYCRQLLSFKSGSTVSRWKSALCDVTRNTDFSPMLITLNNPVSTLFKIELYKVFLGTSYHAKLQDIKSESGTL